MLTVQKLNEILIEITEKCDNANVDFSTNLVNDYLICISFYSDEFTLTRYVIFEQWELKYLTKEKIYKKIKAKGVHI